MGLRPERAVQLAAFEIACARLYVQAGLDTQTIANRLGSHRGSVTSALQRCGIEIDHTRRWPG